jgi:hypothetical protein
MRVYTTSTLRNIWLYGKFLAAIVILAVLVSHVARLWGEEPALQQLQDLLRTEQTQ